MKKWSALFILLFILGAEALPAGQDEYNDCLLEHLKGVKHDAATALIRQACYENYIGPIFPGEKVKKYNECLLEYLVGVESFQAVMEIRNACGSKYLM